MIKDLRENDLGFMVGTFYSSIFKYDIEVLFDRDISLEYIEKNIEYFNSIKQEFLFDICAALKRYYESYKKLYPDLCEELSPDILRNYEVDPVSILKYVKIGVYRFHKCSVDDENIPVINLGGDCEWAGDAGITIIAKNNQLMYVGPEHSIRRGRASDGRRPDRSGYNVGERQYGGFHRIKNNRKEKENGIGCTRGKR